MNGVRKVVVSFMFCCVGDKISAVSEEHLL